MALTGMATGAVPATLATIRVLAAVTPPSPEMGRSSPPPAVHRSGCSRANNGEVWRRIQSEWLILSRPVLPWPGALASIQFVRWWEESSMEDLLTDAARESTQMSQATKQAQS